MWRDVIFFFFFFSSRRRHTSWNCDWSSDVCSSDLPWPSRGAPSVVAGAVANGAFGKPEHARLIGLFGGEGAAFFTACGDAAGVIFVFFAVDPLEQDVE